MISRTFTSSSLRFYGLTKYRRTAKGFLWQKFHPSKILSQLVNTKARLVNTREGKKIKK